LQLKEPKNHRKPQRQNPIARDHLL
jgi:hypothetical protein